MPRSKIWLASGALASALAIATLGPLLVPPAYADDAAEALAKCDALASDPRDPKRYAPPVSDDHFAPGAAIDACEPAVKLNPDSGRAWFELGRSYRIGERDTDAFRAFVAAAKHNYPIAFKFIGDAYLEGRGLPSGERQSPEIAIDWYRKAVDAGYREGQAAIDEVQAKIQTQKDQAGRAALLKQQQEAQAALENRKAQEAAERAKFDPSIFQNSKFMSKIYYYDNTKVDEDLFILYVNGLIEKIGGTEPFFVNGQSCIPEVAGTTTGSLSRAMAQVGTRFAQKIMNGMDYSGINNMINSSTNISSLMTTLQDQGGRDAITLFNRYGCDSDVTHAIMHNINAYFDPSLQKFASPQETAPPAVQPDQPPATTYRKPTMFDCNKKSMGADFVICTYPDLIDAEARLDSTYLAAKAARGSDVRREQIEWMKTYGQNCGVPFRGQPSPEQIRNAHQCILTAIENRTAALRQN